MKKEIHIISFAIPYPTNYGGVIDVFSKIKALHKKGVEITLHCFQYGDRDPQEKLNSLCKHVFYYKRKIGFYGVSASLPYIVYSRRSKKLLNRLQQTTAPILFEGLHTCYYLDHPSLKDKFKIVRCQNIEHEYYDKLSQYGSKIKAIYYQKESDRLKSFEPVLKHAQILLSISQTDQDYFKTQFPDQLVKKLHAFHTDNKIKSLTGSGTYSLFHGSLNISENENSARFLIEEVFNDLDHQLIIAGREPSFELKKLCASKKNITLINEPDEASLNDLVAQAHIQLMHASQQSGIKLKLIKALFCGRHVIANNNMVNEPAIANHVVFANSPKDWKNAILKLVQQPFTTQMQEDRKSILTAYSNDQNAQDLLNNIKF